MLRMMLNQLQARNPQGYQIINSAMQSGGNPQALLQQMFTSSNPMQRQNILNQAKSLGVPDNILGQIQNMK